MDSQSQPVGNSANNHSPSSSGKPVDPKKIFLQIMIVPLVLAFLLGLAIFIPRLLNSPSYDFIYISCKSYCRDTYKVDDGKIVPIETTRSNRSFESFFDDLDTGSGGSSYDSDSLFGESSDYSSFFRSTPDLYLYDVESGKNQQLTLEQAQEYSVVEGSASPDGYRLERSVLDRAQTPFVIGLLGLGSAVNYDSVDDYNKWSLVGHNDHIELDLETPDGAEYTDVELIGWVEN